MSVKRLKDLKGPALAFTTTTCTEHLPLLSHDGVARIVISKLGEVSASTNTSVVAYVVMPSHVHAMLGFPRIEEISTFMQRFKSLTSRAIKDLSIRSFNEMLTDDGRFRLWKRRFDDFIICSEEQFWMRLNYIHNNPVSAGLVLSPKGWAFSSAGDWILNEKGLIEIDKSFWWRKWRE